LEDSFAAAAIEFSCAISICLQLLITSALGGMYSWTGKSNAGLGRIEEAE
jgi:hypothetical protein